MKKALIITYYWPPSGGSGVQRWMYFTKYMEEHGIVPIVLTVDPKKAAYPAFDYTLSEKIKHVKTFYTKPGFNLFGIYSFLKSGNTKKVVPVGDVGGKNKSFVDRLSAFIRANYFIPDARVGWNKHAIPLAKQIIKNEKIDCIITTGPPHSTHLIGLELKKYFSIHWLADLRDPWTDIYYNKIFKRSKRSQNKDNNYELAVLKNADTILTVGPSMKHLLIRKEAELENKCFFIYNGFDQEAFIGLEKKKYPEFTIAHIGVWTLQQSYKEIIVALNEILSQQSNQKIRFILAGSVSTEILKQLKSIPNLIVDYRGKINHREALQEMKNADLLLNCLAIIENSELLISGKLMEYIASGNPIFLIGKKEGDAAKLLSNIENTCTIEPGDSNGMKEKLEQLIWHYPVLKDNHSKISRFSRKETSKELVNLLNLRI